MMNSLRQKSWTWLLRNLALPLGDRVFGQKMIQRLKFLEKAQWWDPEQVAEERDRSLSDLINTAYQEVPYYQEMFDSAGLKPGDIRKPEDLHLLPVSTKEILRRNYPDRITRQTGQKTYEARTSGSTGKNFTVLEDAHTAGWYRAAFLLSLEWAGWKLGEPHLQTGMTTQRSLDRRLKDSLLQCHYISAYDLSDKALDSMLDILEKDHIRHLWGYPGSLYVLARRAQQKGWNQALRSTVTWGDNLYPHYRKIIEEAFCTRVTDTYGCAEGVQIAAQCELGNYHIHSLDTVVEFLDENGLPVQPGQPGNIVVTRLHPGPMPLIRYRIGDVGVAELNAELMSFQTERQGQASQSLPPVQEAICPCGRGFFRIGSIQGRDTDIVVTPSGNRLIVHFFTGLLEHFPEIDTFQVVQENPASITLRIVPFDKLHDQLCDRITAIAQRLKEKGAEELEISIELVPEIPLPPSGKRRFVISNV